MEFWRRFNTFFFLFCVENPKQEHREKKTPDVPSSSESDDDEYGASSDYSKPTSDKSKFQLEYIQNFLKHKLGLSSEDEGDTSATKILKNVDFQGLVDHWKEKGFKKIVTMVGAGISTCKFDPKLMRAHFYVYKVLI